MLSFHAAAPMWSAFAISTELSVVRGNQTVCSFDLQTVSLISGSLAEDSAVYYFVGTAYVDPEEREPTKGRILVLQVQVCPSLRCNRCAPEVSRTSLPATIACPP